MTFAPRSFIRLLTVAAALSLAVLCPTGLRAQSAADGAAPAAQPSSPADLALTPAERQVFVGTYVLSAAGSPERSMPFRIFEQDGQLYGQPHGGQAMRLLYQGENRFRPERELDSLVTFTVKEGKAVSFSVVLPEGSLTGVRVEEGGQ